MFEGKGTLLRQVQTGAGCKGVMKTRIKIGQSVEDMLALDLLQFKGGNSLIGHDHAPRVRLNRLGQPQSLSTSFHWRPSMRLAH